MTEAKKKMRDTNMKENHVKTKGEGSNLKGKKSGLRRDPDLSLVDLRM